MHVNLFLLLGKGVVLCYTVQMTLRCLGNIASRYSYIGTNVVAKFQTNKHVEIPDSMHILPVAINVKCKI